MNNSVNRVPHLPLLRQACILSVLSPRYINLMESKFGLILFASIIRVCFLFLAADAIVYKLYGCCCPRTSLSTVRPTSIDGDDHCNEFAEETFAIVP